jgi:hypothetical protein
MVPAELGASSSPDKKIRRTLRGDSSEGEQSRLGSRGTTVYLDLCQPVLGAQILDATQEPTRYLDIWGQPSMKLYKIKNTPARYFPVPGRTSSTPGKSQPPQLCHCNFSRILPAVV